MALKERLNQMYTMRDEYDLVSLLCAKTQY